MSTSNKTVQQRLLDVTQPFDSLGAVMEHTELLEAMGYHPSWVGLFLLHYNKRNELAARRAEIERTGLDPLDPGRQFFSRAELTAYLQQLREWGYTQEEIMPYALVQAETLLFSDSPPDSQSPASP